MALYAVCTTAASWTPFLVSAAQCDELQDEGASRLLWFKLLLAPSFGLLLLAIFLLEDHWLSKRARASVAGAVTAAPERSAAARLPSASRGAAAAVATERGVDVLSEEYRLPADTFWSQLREEAQCSSTRKRSWSSDDEQDAESWRADSAGSIQVSEEPSPKTRKRKRSKKQQRPQQNEEDKEQPFRFRLVHESGASARYRVDPATTMAEILDFYCQRHSTERSAVVLRYEGYLVPLDETPDKLGLPYSCRLHVETDYRRLCEEATSSMERHEAALQKRLQSERQERQSAEVSVMRLESDLAAITAEKSELLRDYEALEEEATAAREQLAKLERDVRTHQQARREAVADLQALQKDVAASHDIKQRKKMERALARHKDEAAELRDKLERVEANLESAQREAEAVQDVEVRLSSVSSELEQTAERLRVAEQEGASDRAASEAHQQRAAELELRVATLEQEHRSTAQALEAAEARITELQLELETEVAKAAQQASILQRVRDDHQQERELAQSARRQLEAEREEHRSALEQLQRSMQLEHDSDDEDKPAESLRRERDYWQLQAKGMQEELTELRRLKHSGPGPMSRKRGPRAPRAPRAPIAAAEEPRMATHHIIPDPASPRPKFSALAKPFQPTTAPSLPSSASSSSTNSSASSSSPETSPPLYSLPSWSVPSASGAVSPLAMHGPIPYPQPAGLSYRHAGVEPSSAGNPNPNPNPLLLFEQGGAVGSAAGTGVGSAFARLDQPSSLLIIDDAE